MQLRIEAVIFDVFGTLVDWRSSVAEQMDAFLSARAIVADPFEIAEAWRAEYQPAMERIRSGGRGYVRLDELHRENLEIVLQRFGLSNRISEDEKSALNRVWERLRPWPDTVEGLDAIRHSRIVATCSNGSIAMMARLARFGGLHFDAILGADIARTYKPRPEVYLKSAGALGLQPAQVMMVAAHNSDLHAAAACGLGTAFIPRPDEHGSGTPPERHPDGEWDLVAQDLVQLAQMLGV